MKHMFMIILVATAAAAAGAADRAEFGEPAPRLQIEKWVKGEAVELGKGDEAQVVVVEFWGTWCSPCRRSIPHLTELQKKYKDKGVTFVGVTYNDKDLKKVEQFVKDQGDKMGYAVAYDDGTTAKAYFDRWEVPGVPHAFIVDRKGRMVWHDHPMDPRFEQVLKKVAADKFTAGDAETLIAERKAQAERRMKAAQKAGEYLELISADEEVDAEEITAAGEEFLKLATGEVDLLNQFGWFLLTSEELKNRDLEFAMRVAKAAYDASKGENPSVVDTYARALFDTGKIKEAIEYQKKAIELADHPELRKELKKTLDRYMESRE